MGAVRHARAGDIPGILDCLDAAFRPYRDQYRESAYRDTVLDADSLRLRMGQMSVLVAEADGQIAGTVAVGQLDHDHGHLRGMAVLPRFERAGIGRRLLRRAFDELAVRGCARVTLGTTAPLTRAARFYEAAGFQRTGRIGGFFDMRLIEFAAPVDRTFSIREAVPDDGDDVRRIVNAAYLVERDFVTGERLSHDELRSCLDRGTFLVATRAGEAVSACVFLRPDTDRRTYLGLLAVDPGAQKRGLGALMMAAAERWCRERGDEAIDIRVVNLRTELPPFYRARGFVENGTAPFEDARLFKPAHFTLMTLAF
jgi:GNAT superfamily N-acetyltransferase